jgi:very-short-patch-repair endonuclease
MRGQIEVGEKPLSRSAGEGAERSEAGEGQQRRPPFGPAPKLTRLARELRRNSTDAERRLWAALRSRTLTGYKFRRQVPIGPFVADFACTRYLVVVEADGGQHANSKNDVKRTAWLESRGWRVLRFWNNDILKNTQGVIGAILSELQQRDALTLPRLRRGPLPLPQCGRGDVANGAGYVE